MLRSSNLLAVILLVSGLLYGSSAWAVEPTPSPTPAPADTPTVKCALDEFPVVKNGVTTCTKVPTCTKDEVNSYDTATQKFVCKKLIKCDPRHQQAAYVNGKNVCIDVPDCEKQGKHYAFDGSKMVCQ